MENIQFEPLNGGEHLYETSSSHLSEDAERLQKFSVALPVFEGHFDALLDMIERQDVDICDISLTDVTGQYLEYISVCKEMDLAVSSEFLYVAAYLLNLKSKKILPEIKVEEEKVEDIETSLVDHVVQYRLFKKIAAVLKDRKDLFSKIFHRPRVETGSDQQKQYFLKDVSVSDLTAAFRKIWLDVKDRGKDVEIVDEIITVEEKIEQISRKLDAAPEGTQFEHLFMKRSRLEVIVTFLALLEMVRLKRILLKQEMMFGQIIVFSSGKEPVLA